MKGIYIYASSPKYLIFHFQPKEDIVWRALPKQENKWREMGEQGYRKQEMQHKRDVKKSPELW